MLNGRSWRGAEGMAGKIGHTIVAPTAELCLCGRQGCVERSVSGPYMVQRACDLLQHQPEQATLLRSLLSGNLGSLTAQNLSQAAAQGNEFAQSILARGACALGAGIGNAANFVNPQCFVLGGGVTKPDDRFWQVGRDTARRTALPGVNFEVIPAALGDDAPLRGAIALA
ncbi:ROK family protein [Phormidium tenue FACHB-886]|nr:ROK family protein [Phormidium tenue FACHB-886]